MQKKSVGITSVKFDVMGQLLTIYSAFNKYLKKKGSKMRQCISCLWTSIQTMIQLRGRSKVIFSLSLVTL
jgi:hypothetical protein